MSKEVKIDGISTMEDFRDNPLDGDKIDESAPDLLRSELSIVGGSVKGKWKPTFPAVRQALRLELVGEVCKTIAATARGSLDITEYEKIIKERLSKLSKREREEVWHYCFLHESGDSIDEEMLPPEGDEVKCKVWELDANGKRNGFELFVKEIVLGGEEWKWVPDSKSIWYPGGNKK